MRGRGIEGRREQIARGCRPRDPELRGIGFGFRTQSHASRPTLLRDYGADANLLG